MKRLLVIGLITSLIVLSVLYIKVQTITADPPHSSAQGVYCNSCHQVHKAPGKNLTTDASNWNVCMSACHNSSGTAPMKAFSLTMQASPWSTRVGTSHRWDAQMPATDSPNNAYGLRWSTSLSSQSLKSKLIAYNYVVTCSVCHDQHNQAALPWDPYAGAWQTIGQDSGWATPASSNATTLNDNKRSAYWTNNMWANFFVKITSPTTTPNYGQIRQVTSNTTTQLTVSAPWTTNVKAGDKYEIIGRKFQRSWTTLNGSTTDINDMCEDCHYYRRPGTPGANINTWDGNKKSHPVVKIFTSAQGETPNVTNPGEFNAAPFEPGSANWAWQTGSRYHLSGNGDINPTNNIVLDNAKKVRCLSCHGVHYRDSDSSSVDAP